MTNGKNNANFYYFLMGYRFAELFWYYEGAEFVKKQENPEIHLKNSTDSHRVKMRVPLVVSKLLDILEALEFLEISSYIRTEIKDYLNQTTSKYGGQHEISIDDVSLKTKIKAKYKSRKFNSAKLGRKEAKELGKLLLGWKKAIDIELAKEI